MHLIRKPMPEKKIDRMVMNIKISITAAGGTALYSYNFGNNKLKEKRERSTASEEEQGRVK